MRPTNTESRRLFSSLADDYERAVNLLSFGQDRQWKRGLARTLRAGGPSSYLDLGCGTGAFARMVAAEGPPALIVGLDLVPEMIDVARRQSARLQVHYVRQDMARLGVLTGSVDCVVAGYALRNAPDVEGTLREVARVLKPQGEFGFIEFSKPSNRLLGLIQLGIIAVWAAVVAMVVFRRVGPGMAIPRSLRSYPSRRQFVDLLERVGFGDIHLRQVSAGFVTIGRCRKAHACT